MKFYVTSSKYFSAGSLQWAPTLTSHDPNPPITLESGAGGISVNVGLGEAVFTGFVPVLEISEEEELLPAVSGGGPYEVPKKELDFISQDNDTILVVIKAFLACR